METVEIVPLIEKYKRMYREDPSSKVFAPLADFYRKEGKQNKALIILKEGIKRHPNYILGHIGLANCYFDLEKYELAYEVVISLIKNNRENIKLQKLFARICEKTNRSYEALETYKFIQFLDPKDEMASKRLVDIDAPPEVFSVPKCLENDQADWVAVDFSVEESPVNMKIIDKLVGVSLRQNDYKKAYEYLDASLDLDPDNQWAREMKKDIHKKYQPNQNNHDATHEKPAGKKVKLLNLLSKVHSRAARYHSFR